MRIGFPLLKRDVPANMLLAESFHGCQFIAVYETGSNMVSVYKPSEMDFDEEGSGLIHFLKNEKVEALVSHQCHPMVVKFFRDNGIEVYKALGSEVLYNIRMLASNELTPFSLIKQELVSPCSKNCQSCTSTAC